MIGETEFAQSFGFWKLVVHPCLANVPREKKFGFVVAFIWSASPPNEKRSALNAAQHLISHPRWTLFSQEELDWKKTVWTLATIRQQVLRTIWRPNSGEFCHLTMQITDSSVPTKFGRYNQVDSCWKGTFRTRLLVLFAIDVLVVIKFYCTLFYYNHQYQINHKAE